MTESDQIQFPPVRPTGRAIILLLAALSIGIITYAILIAVFIKLNPSEEDAANPYAKAIEEWEVQGE